MDNKMNGSSDHKAIRLFNTPLETGLRTLIMLNANQSQKIDAEKLMYLDFLCLNTSDIGGPESLHAPIPNRGIQVYSRKDLIQKGLVILLSKELVDLSPTSDGFLYSINEAGKAFLNLFQTKYYHDLVARASWIFERFNGHSSSQIKAFIDSNIQRWGSEFVAKEKTVS
jgi:hypothetical protein